MRIRSRGDPEVTRGTGSRPTGSRGWRSTDEFLMRSNLGKISIQKQARKELFVDLKRSLRRTRPRCSGAGNPEAAADLGPTLIAATSKTTK